MAQKRRRSKQWIYWLVILVLLVAAGVVAYLVYDNYFNKKEAEIEQSSVSLVEEKVEEQKSESEDDGTVEEKKVKQYEGSDPNQAEELSGVITYAGVSGDKLMIRVNIDQYLGSGSCELKLVDGNGDTHNETAAIVSSATTATCEGFDVSLSNLRAGDYGIEIKISSGGKTGTIKGETKI